MTGSGAGPKGSLRHAREKVKVSPITVSNSSPPKACKGKVKISPITDSNSSPPGHARETIS